MNKKVKKMMDENERREQAITAENQEAYTDMIVYLRVSRISDFHQEQVRGDIIDMITDGQSRGQSMEEIIGDDYRVFCDAVIDAFPPKGLKEKFLDAADITCLCLAILGIIHMGFNIIENILMKKDLLSYSISASDVLNFIVIVIIANLVVYRICRGAFDRPEKNRLKEIGGTIFAFLSIAIIFAGSKMFLDSYTVNFGLWIAAAVIAAAYGAHRYIEAREPAK